MKKISEDKILAYIEEHLERGIQIKDLAEAFGYSQDHFRHLFRIYYGTSPAAYIRRRKLIHSVQRIQEGAGVAETAALYGFDTEAGFSKAFRKEFGFPARAFKEKGQLLEDVVPDPVYDKNRIQISILETPALEMVGKPLLPEDCHYFDLLEEAAYWLEHGIPRLNQEEMDFMDCYKKDLIGMWYHDSKNPQITYLLGPVVKDSSKIPEGMIPVTIPGRKYAVFEMKGEAQGPALAEEVRSLCRYIFWEWLPANEVLKDKWGFTYERYQGKKASIYLPLL